MIQSPRLFVPEDLYPGAEIHATPGQAHYLGRVMRRAVGDRIRLFNGQHGEFVARLTSLDRGAARLVVEQQTRPQAPEPDIWLVFALLKRDATGLLVRMATELGAARLLPVITARTNSERVNPDRLAAIALEAAEQSERLTLPEIAPVARLEAVLAQWPPGKTLVAAVERASVPAISSPAGGLLIGPEGGFTPAELELLGRAPFVVTASLGPRILRAETAALVGLALLQQ